MLNKFAAPRRLGVLAAGFAAASILAASAAQATSASASVLIASNVTTLRAIKVGTPVTLPLGNGEIRKVSNPTVYVSATVESGPAPIVSQKINSAPTLSCATKDDPANGYFNRVITVSVPKNTTATVYTRITFDTTTAAGKVYPQKLEPLGANGLKVTAALLPLSLPFSVCVS